MDSRITCISVIVALNLVLGLLSLGETFGSNKDIHYLDQGFDKETRQTFYHSPQGTKLLPLSWFLALEQATNTNRFLDDKNLRRLGLLPDHSTLQNSDRLPVGFAKTFDAIEGKVWVGLTCAACHTTEISYNNQTIRIDGGPSMLDAMTLLDEIGRSVQVLVVKGSDEDKFSRFAKAVKKQDKKTTEKQLKEEVGKYYESLQKPQEIAKERNIALYPNRWGKGRLDALGRGGNTILLQLDRSNLRSADAPVSFPAIWNTWSLNWIQWNGAVMQPMGRNLLQAIGLGARLTWDPNDNRFRTSVSVKDLAKIEELIQKLKPPAWPSKIFTTPIDEEKASRGATLYKEQCAHCHVPELTPPNNNHQPFKMVNLIPLEEIGTDPLSATNFHNRTVKTGPLGFGLLTAADVAQYLTTNILEGQYHELDLPQEQQDVWNGYRPNIIQAPLAYMARPHSGVWALAPYLHNGSVPNLYQLLSPREERENVFYVGHSEFDPRHVGFVTQKKTPTDFKFDTTFPGNSNAGHEFRDGPLRNGVIGPALSETERWDLIEYLKTI
jgi:mono/diheme cytochrome c family protein